MFSVGVTGRSGHSLTLCWKKCLGGYASGLGQILDHKEEIRQGRTNLFDVPGPTLNMGSIHEGDNPIRICGEVEMQFDLRIAPTVTEAIREDLKNKLLTVGNALDLTIDLKTLMPPIPPFEQESDGKIVRLCEKLTGHSASAVNFATEAPFLQSLGMETIVMSPGSIKEPINLMNISNLIRYNLHQSS